jgi:hypothetical protein
MPKSWAAGAREGGWAGVNFWFPLNNLSLFWPIDTELGVWVVYVMSQLEIATQVSVIKVKITFTKKEFSFCSIT